MTKPHRIAMLPPQTRSTCKEPEQEKGLERLLPESENVDSGNLHLQQRSTSNNTAKAASSPPDCFTSHLS